MSKEVPTLLNLKPRTVRDAAKMPQLALLVGTINGTSNSITIITTVPIHGHSL